MNPEEPIRFEPLFYKRVWGGRMLGELFGKPLPSDVPIGESWEVVDREEAQSVVRGGGWDGATLHALWTEHRDDVFGPEYAGHGASRFPLLIKLLDARDKLSVQVHPPAAVAEELGGEPKTEMWHVLAADEGAAIYAGLRKGVLYSEFEAALGRGDTADLIHRIPTAPGDTLFIPSGRIHAIGGGNVILEVQQNSDTTYRVFDWNRKGLDGKPRDLHIAESLRSIDFTDFEPEPVEARDGVLVDDPLFRVERIAVKEETPASPDDRFAICACIAGRVRAGSEVIGAGGFFLAPAGGRCRIRPESEAEAVVVRATLPPDGGLPPPGPAGPL